MLTREEALDTMGATLDDWIDKKNMHMLIDKIYVEHEAQMKAKDEEIERLKAIVEEAIRKPMGVEPHSWSDYKIKDNA